MNLKCLRYPRTLSVDPFPLRVLLPASTSTNESLEPTMPVVPDLQFIPRCLPENALVLSTHLGVRMCWAPPRLLRTTREVGGRSTSSSAIENRFLSPDCPQTARNSSAPSGMTRLTHHVIFNRFEAFPLKNVSLVSVNVTL